MLEEVAQREEKHEKSQKSQAAAMLVHDVGVCPSTVPWEELTAAQLEPLRIILSQQRKSHILGYTAKLEKAAQMKQFKEVEINDVKAFLSVAPSCVNVNTAPNTSPNTLGLNTNNSSVDAKNLRSLSDLIFNEIQTSPKLLETTMLLLTSNNCIKQLEALPRELFAPPTSPTHKGFGSIMQRHKSMAALMTINR